MTVRKYAEGTKVSVESSRAEIASILSKHGVDSMGWATKAGVDTLYFELKGGAFRLQIARPSPEEVRRMYPNAWDYAAKTEAEWRRRWRANVLLLKAKLEFIESGDSTIERELLPYRLLEDGRTLEEAITANALPLLGSGS